MNRGPCRSCRNESELHLDYDGKWVCEDCLLSPQSAQAHSKHSFQSRGSGVSLSNPTSALPSRTELLAEIVTRADNKFIQSLIKSEIDSIRQTLSHKRGWIRLVEETDNDLVLLRIATELGYELPDQLQAASQENKENVQLDPASIMSKVKEEFDQDSYVPQTEPPIEGEAIPSVKQVTSYQDPS